jgi:hypothetical protein
MFWDWRLYIRLENKDLEHNCIIYQCVLRFAVRFPAKVTRVLRHIYSQERVGHDVTVVRLLSMVHDEGLFRYGNSKLQLRDIDLSPQFLQQVRALNCHKG